MASPFRSLTHVALYALFAVRLAAGQISISIGSTATFGSRCNIHNATLALPQEGDVELVAGDIAKYIALAVGQQEYTCQNNQWVVQGVKASLFDISCQYNTSSISALSLAFSGLAGAVMDLIDSEDYSGNFARTVQSAAGVPLKSLGSMESSDAKTFDFDFTSAANGPLRGRRGIGSGQVDQTQPAPVASYDVDWFRVNLTSGNLAQEAYVVYTSGGRPLTTGLACPNGEKDNVPFSAQVWFYVSNTQNRWSQAAFANNCFRRVRRTKPQKQMVILANTVQYGQTDKECTSIEDCTKKCLAVKNCVGFSISTEDGVGYTKLQVLEAKLGYAFNFNSGVVRSISNKQYVDRQGEIHDCPRGQVTSPDFLGCIFPIECAAAASTESAASAPEEAAPSTSAESIAGTVAGTIGGALASKKPAGASIEVSVAASASAEA